MTHIVTAPTLPTSLIWTKSSYSGGEGNECVEVAAHDGTTAIRDSKDPGRAALRVPRTAFTAFIDGLKH
ncbi:DUF397 domain-containing protein [Streptomyces sp. R39]|uniref:DUF397 domain-containing protein n=1 Tax=Streptomyces sp. R39 TaxID=3238631 RepID=A0AB39QSA5_9ACTN